MAAPLFRPHGSAQVELAGAILTVHMRGDWNAEMRNHTAQAMMEHVPALNATGPWAIIHYLHDTLVYSEEIYTSTRQAYAARPPSSELAAIAFVVGPEVEGATLMRPKLDTLLDGIVTSRVFTNPDEALAWLLTQLPST